MLEGRTAFVTDGSGGVGLTIARRLAREGVRVVLVAAAYGLPRSNSEA